MKECKYEDWQIVDDEWNHDFVCTKGLRRICIGCNCPDFEPKEENENDK